MAVRPSSLDWLKLACFVEGNKFPSFCRLFIDSKGLSGMKLSLLFPRLLGVLPNDIDYKKGSRKVINLDDSSSDETYKKVAKAFRKPTPIQASSGPIVIPTPTGANTAITGVELAPGAEAWAMPSNSFHVTSVFQRPCSPVLKLVAGEELGISVNVNAKFLARQRKREVQARNAQDTEQGTPLTRHSYHHVVLRFKWGID
ncbi:hypothetical protein QBC40DRAFT_312008 [Triangularia verruculosa]|uniref:Uncharacterized protein n=1 Tax=Triangularia verruculosa TaxID=2587418 RepID=A0AAN7B2A3_9PEZI|nr:hypothetical protein QBC40DRAFT_312008 [Triangularia verruculosa]